MSCFCKLLTKNWHNNSALVHACSGVFGWSMPMQIEYKSKSNEKFNTHCLIKAGTLLTLSGYEPVVPKVPMYKLLPTSLYILR